ncbi:MAG: O-antigen ligase family protein [Caldilineaceae bacterium]
MLKWIQFAMVLLVVPAMVPRRFVHWLIISLLSGAILQALLGLYQFIFHRSRVVHHSRTLYARQWQLWSAQSPGGYLGLSLPVAFSLALWSLTQHWRPQFQEAGAGKRMHWQLLWTSFTVGAAVAIALGLLASWSRGGWLGMVGSSFTVLLLRSKWVAAWLGTFGAILAVTLLFGAVQPQWVPAPIAARFEEIPAYFGLTDLLQQPVTDENFAIIERLAHWDAALRMWDRAPWLGIGPGNYATIYPEVNLPQWEEALGHAHNIYLNMLAEGGLLGFFAYLLLWSSILFWLGQQLRRAQLSPVWQAPQWTIPLLIGVIGVVVHLSIHNFFDNLFVQGNYLHIAMWLVVARIAVGRENHKFS